MFEKGYKFVTSGAIIAAICFFLPIMSGSFLGLASAQASGWQMAAGMNIGNGREIDGEPIYFLILAAAIGLIVLAKSFGQRDKIEKIRDGIMVLVASVIPVLFLWIKMDEGNKQAMGFGFNMEYGIGYYGIILGFLLAAFGGFQNMGMGNTFPGISLKSAISNPKPGPKPIKTNKEWFEEEE